MSSAPRALRVFQCPQRRRDRHHSARHVNSRARLACVQRIRYCLAIGHRTDGAAARVHGARLRRTARTPRPHVRLRPRTRVRHRETRLRQSSPTAGPQVADVRRFEISRRGARAAAGGRRGTPGLRGICRSRGRHARGHGRRGSPGSCGGRPRIGRGRHTGRTGGPARDCRRRDRSFGRRCRARVAPLSRRSRGSSPTPIGACPFARGRWTWCCPPTRAAIPPSARGSCRRAATLLVAVPAEDDLIELREALHGTAVAYDRGEALVAEHQAAFTLVDRSTARERRPLGRDALLDVLRATYRGARRSAAAQADALTSIDVTFASELFLFRRRERPGA